MMAKDNIPNIRLGFVKISIKLWTCIADKSVRTDILNLLNLMKEDTDNEVKKESEKTLNYFKNHSAEIIKNDEIRNREDISKELFEMKLQRKNQNEKHEEEEKQKKFYPSPKKIKQININKRSLNNLFPESTMGVILPTKFSVLKLNGTRNSAKRKFSSHNSTKDQPLRLPSIEPGKKNLNSIRMKADKFSPLKYRLNKITKRK